MFDNFINWEMLSVFGTLSMIVFMFVEYTKELKVFKSIPTKYYAGLVAFVLITLMTLQSGNFSFVDIPLYILSAIAITFTSNGVSDFNKNMKNN